MIPFPRTNLATPPPIGSTTPNTGAFTTLSNSGIQTATGGVDMTITTHSATEAVAAATMHGNDHIITGAYTVTLPAAVLKMRATFRCTTAAIASIDSTAPDAFVLGGTALTAGNKITSDGVAGSEVELVCLTANQWTVRNVTGLFIDGGA